MFRNPTSQERKIQASLMQPKVRELPAENCLNRALEDIQNLNLDFSQRLMQEHRFQYQWLWNDPDIGPVKWLQCNKKRDVSWYDSLAVFLHELSHEVRNNGCIFNSNNNSKICLELPQDLPLRSIAKIQDLTTLSSDRVEDLVWIQRLYLTDLDQPPLLLFDELQGYIITSKAYTATLTKLGAAALKNQKRLANYLPLFMLYSVRYLEELRNRSPAAFEENFGVCSKNYLSLNLLLRAQRMHTLIGFRQ